MLSDEEKEAIEWLKRLVKLNKRDNLDDTFAEILLNLIEKQSKEIESLKEKIKTFKIEDENIYLQFGEIIEKKRWKDKIKAKIEELEKEQEDNRKVLYNAVNNLFFKEIDKMSNRIIVNMSIRDILKSILSKEE